MNLWMLAAILFCGPMAAHADNEKEFQVVSGDFNVVKQKGKTGTVEFSYDNAKMANLHTNKVEKETLVQYLKKNDEKAFEKWSETKDKAKETFIKRWNEEKKKCIELVDEGKGDYKIKIKAELFDAGNAASAMWSMSKRDGGVVISGTLEVLDAKGKVVCKMKINHYRGASSRNFDMKNPNFQNRFINFHRSLAKDLLETIL